MFSFAILAAALPVIPLQEVETVSVTTQRLILVRHGEASLNLPDQNGVSYVSGKSNAIPLTPKGEGQALSLASKLVTKLPKDAQVAVCTSTALRAHATAMRLFEELSKQFPCTWGESYEELCELGHGPWEGAPKDAIYEKEMKKWERLSAKEKLTAPKIEGGESYQAVIDRALPVLQQILDTHRDRTIFVVSHFMTMNALSLFWTHPDLSEELGTKLPQIIFDNCDLLVVDFPEGFIEKGCLLHHIKSNI